MAAFLVTATTIFCAFTVGKSQTNCPNPSMVAVHNIHPRSGTNGTRVTIKGCGLSNVQTVLFNSTQNNSFRVDNGDLAFAKDGSLRFRIINNSPPVGYNASLVFLDNANITLATLNSSYWKWLQNVQVHSLSPSGGQAGTIFRIFGCFPPQCASESTSLTNVTIGGIEAEILNQSSKEVELRAGYSDLAISSAPLLFLAGSGATYYTGTGIVWKYLEPGRIAEVTPTSGQRGTRVTITGESLLGVEYDNGGRSTIHGSVSDIRSVIIAGLKCAVLSVSPTVIEVQIPSGPPSIGGIQIETNAGPYVGNTTAWRKIADGTITSIIPSTMQPGGEVALCGINVLPDGAAIMTLTMAGQSTSNPSFHPVLNKSCIIVQTPLIPHSSPLPSPGPVLLIADTYATVDSNPGVNFTYARIDRVYPTAGRQGTKVTITGSHLDLQLGRIEFVYLSGVLARIRVVSPDRIVIRAGIGPSSGSISLGSVKVIARGNSTLNGMISLSLTFKSVWKYIPFGNISQVTPNEGQIGIRVNISGHFLLGLGATITRVEVGTFMATILSSSNTSVVVSIPNSTNYDIPVDLLVESDSGAQTVRTEAFTFRKPGSITDITPLSGQLGTKVVLTGRNLLGNGSRLASATLVGVRAKVVRQSSNNVVLEAGAYATNVSTSGPVVLTSGNGAIVTSSPLHWIYIVAGHIASVTPSEGQIGSLVRIIGTNLLGGGVNISSVTLCGNQANIVFVSFSLVMVRFVTDVNSDLRGDVVITANTGAQAIWSQKWTCRKRGIITNISPVTGQRGTLVTLTGSNVLAYGSQILNVTIAHVPVLSVLEQSSSRVVVRVGAATEGLSGNVIIFADTEAAVTSVNLTFTFSKPGNISSVSPSSGLEGTLVVIRGTLLHGRGSLTTGVTLNEIPVSQIVYDSDTEIIVVAGPTSFTSSTQPGNVEITSNTGEIVTKERIFSYAAPVVINSVTPRSGQMGTVVNVDLSVSSSTVQVVHVAGTEASVMSRKGNTVIIRLGRPSRQGTFLGDVVVTLKNGSKARRKNSFTYTTEGMIFSINPAQGQIGTIVKVTGRNLLGNGTRLVNASLADLSGRVVNSSDTEAFVVVTESNFRRSLGNLTLTSDSGAVITRVDGWESVPVGLIQSVFPNFGQFGTVVTIRGQRLLGGGTRIETVYLSGIPVFSVVSANDTIVVVQAADGQNTTYQTLAVTLISDTGSIVELPLGWTYRPGGKIVSVSPAFGQLGTRVTISGYNLLGQGKSVRVSLGRVDALTVESATDTFIIVRANAVLNITGARENVVITANTGAFIIYNASWTYRVHGVITAVYPPTGQHGTEIVLRGHNLFGYGSRIVRATIGGIEASVKQNMSRIVVISAGLSTTLKSDVDITLEADSGAQIIAERAFSYIPPGQIMSAQPPSGLHGAVVTIRGFQLFGYGVQLKSVTIAGILATFNRFAVNSSVITVTAGFSAHPTTGPIVIISSSGAIVTYSNWTYLHGGIISALFPTVGQPGTSVTLSGSDLLSGGNTVKSVIVNGSTSFKIESANDTHIEFLLGPRVPSGQSQPGVSVVLNSGSTYSTNANLFAYTSDGGTVTSVNPMAGHEGSVVVIQGIDLLNGGNVSNVFLSGIKVKTILSANESVVTAVAGRGYAVTGDVIVASSNGFVSGLHNGWQYLPSISKSAVSPGQGQKGTVVTISAHEALLNFRVASVTIAGIPAQLLSTSTNTTYFDDQNRTVVEEIQQLSLVAGSMPMTAMPKTGDIVLQSQTKEELVIIGGWTYLPSQVVEYVTPTNGYKGTRVTIVGRNLLAGGTRILSVSLAGISTRILNEHKNSQGRNVVMVEVSPDKEILSGISGNIVITSDDGATFVATGRQWTYLNVQIASSGPNYGQVGTLVTIAGMNLLAGGNTISSATLAGVTATIVKASTSEVVLRARNSTSTGLDDIILNIDTGAQIELSQTWTYTEPGNITEVQPEFGREGTVVAITGTYLLGGGKRASNVFLNGVPAGKIVASSPQYVEVVAGRGPSGGRSRGAVVIVADTGATISRSSAFNYVAVGALTKILPDFGQYGTEVTIQGSDLLSGSSSLQYVKLAGVEATIVGQPTDTTVTVKAGFPPRLDSFADVIEVRSSSGGITSSSNLNFSYLLSGQIYTVSPSSGQLGTYVHLTGERLLGGGSTLRAAYLGSVPALIQTPLTNETVTIRAGATVETGRGNVTLISENGAIVVKLDGWTYLQSSNITKVNPSVGRQGTNIRITGNRLTGGGNNITSVRLCDVEVMSFTEGIGYVDVRAGNGSTAVISNSTCDVVTTSDTGAQTILRNGFTYASPGRVSKLSPSNGISDEEVNITGVNLLGAGSRIVTVTFGNIKAQVIRFNDSFVTVLTGVNDDGEPKPNVDVYIEADTGDSTYAFGAWSYRASCTGNQFGLYPNCTNCSAECSRCFDVGNTNCRSCRRFTVPTTSSNGIRKHCVFSCPNFINGTTCVEKCSDFQFVNVSVDVDSRTHKYCRQCNSLCNPSYGCDGPGPTDCFVCLYVRDEGSCTSNCPIDKYSDNNQTCQPCHSECKKGFGCRGPNEWDCTLCAHFNRTRARCSLDANRIYDCVASCSGDYFANGTKCLECDDQCQEGCSGSSPHQCNRCAKYVKLQNGLSTCVASCNADSGPYLFYVDVPTKRCERCHPQCSPLGGCTGPEAQDCLQCRNFSKRNTANRTECVGQCSSDYYADEQFHCNSCDPSCTHGCYGPTSSDCTTTSSNVGTFDAGMGTIAVVVAICVVLLAIVILVLVRFCFKDHKDRYSLNDIPLSPRNQELRYCESERRQQVKETSINERPPAALPGDEGKPRPLSSVPLLKHESAVQNYIPMDANNETVEADDYTGMSNPEAIADSVYVDSEQPPPVAQNRPPTQKALSSRSLPPPATQDVYDDIEVDQGETLYEDVHLAAAAEKSKVNARPMSQPSKSTSLLLPPTKTEQTGPTLPPRGMKPHSFTPSAQQPAEQPPKLGPKRGSSEPRPPPLQPRSPVSMTPIEPQLPSRGSKPGKDGTGDAPVLPPRNAPKPYDEEELYEDCSNVEID